MVSSIDIRLAFKNAKLAFQKANIVVKDTQLTNSYLRFEVPLSSTQTAYDVPITVTQQANGQGSQTITEQRLQLQDSFFCSHMGYFFQVRVTSGGYTGLANNLFTFPSTAFQSSIDLDRLQMFWNGYMKLTVNQTVITPQWDLKRHLYAPDGQRPMVSTGNTFPWVFTDQNDGSQDGFYAVEPNWVLIGSRNNQMTINYPSQFDSTVFTGGGSLSVAAVIVMRGVLAQDTTPVR